VKYEQVCRYLDNCLIFGIKPDLVRIRKVLDLLGSPHKKYDFIHVVGTNGKTSTTIMAASILHQHGKKCGYYISPHIDSYTERMWISGKEVSEDRFAKLFEDIYPCVEEVNRMNLGGHLTQFEILTAMAFKLGEEEKLDVMVLEAGMGGRWDATNAAESKVVGLTGVSLEHTRILGNTIEKIALEKVEVIKNRALVATLTRDRKVLDVIKKKVKDSFSKLFVFGDDFCILNINKGDVCESSFDIKGTRAVYKNLKLPLFGEYQKFNLSLALTMAELYLGMYGENVEEKLLKESMLPLKIKGRFEILKENPLVIADTSHNPEGIKNLVKNISGYFGKRRKIIIFAVLGDKDYKKMISSILGVSDILILTSSLNSRSLDIGKLQNEVLKIKNLKAEKKKNVPSNIYSMDNIENSLNFALNFSKSNDIICITGSITNLENLGGMIC